MIRRHLIGSVAAAAAVATALTFTPTVTHADGGAAFGPGHPPSLESQAVMNVKLPLAMELYQARLYREGIIHDIPAPPPLTIDPATLAQLETLLGVPNATKADGTPAQTMPDVIAAIQRKNGVTPQDTQTVSAQPANAQNTTQCSTATSNNFCYASTIEQGFTEPTSSPNPNDPYQGDSGYYANLCGPGSATALIWHWSSSKEVNFNDPAYGSGPSGFLLAIADPNHGGMMRDQGYRNSSGGEVYLTYPGDESNSINGQIGSNYYSTTDGPSSDQFVSALDFDIGTSGVPLIMEVKTDSLTNWGAFPGNLHLIAADANDDVDNLVQYQDTAGSYSSNNNGTAGDHIVSRSQITQSGRVCEKS